MTEWLVPTVVAAGLQIAIGLLMLGRMSSLLDHLKEDVQDIQRDKLDVTVHEATVQRLDSDIGHVRHGVNDARQRIHQIETRRVP